MKKINFKKPKFILPLVILPFILGIAYFVLPFIGSSEDENNVVMKEGINYEIPEANVDTEEKSKIQEFKEELLMKRKYSGIKDIGDEEYKRTKVENQDSLIKADSIRKTLVAMNKERINSIQKRREERQNLQKNLRERINKAGTNNPSANNKRRNVNTNNYQANKRSIPAETKSREQEEMEMFKKQMVFMDSMSNPEKYSKKNISKYAGKRDVIEKPEENFKISKTSNIDDNLFNTVKANEDENFISAILDEGIKVYRDSRVRIRLMDNVFINDKLFSKGQYLYGIVKSFGAQRVIIRINSVINNGEIFPVDISLYDNDGIEGVYVPNSMFSKFAEELGVQTTQNASGIGTNDTGDDDNSNALFESISSVVQSGTNAVRKALKSDKVRIKYNHVVYLVNNEK